MRHRPDARGTCDIQRASHIPIAKEKVKLIQTPARTAIPVSPVIHLALSKPVSTETGPSDFNTDEEMSLKSNMPIVFSVITMMTSVYVFDLAHSLPHA